MNSKNFMLRLGGTIFCIVSAAHLWRVISGASVVIDGWELPIWMNVAGFIGTAFLCGAMWWASGNKKG